MNITPGVWVGEMYSMPTGAGDFNCGASVWADDGTHRKEVAFVKELPEQEENLRLLAAAPDLLRIAELIVQAKTGNIPPGIVNEARHAIGKIRGT